MRVVFLGSQEIGAGCLRVILEAGHEVVGVGAFRPKDHEHWTDDVTRIVKERGLPPLKARRFRTSAAVERLRSLEPDILFAVGWRWILPPEVLGIPPKGCLGIHGSLLPRIRGFAPVNWALIRDEPQTGPTLFYFDDGTDTGDIVGQRPFPITDEDDAGTVRARLASESVALLAEHVDGLAAGTAPRIPQTEEGVSHGPQRRPEDGAVDWTATPRDVFNWVRGLTRPYPGAFSEVGGRKVHVWKVRPLEGGGPGPGILAPDERRIVIGAGVGAVEMLDAGLDGDDRAGAFDRAAGALRRSGSFDVSRRERS